MKDHIRPSPTSEINSSQQIKCLEGVLSPVAKDKSKAGFSVLTEQRRSVSDRIIPSGLHSWR